ncbi:sensor domain-containing diguanylate cyclase [Methylobacterium radiodurans]|uniref:diguanylate cyclase n=1 Tax=Methylobacterium radiodurans TaxID=2202828 RepID=A0A2U8VQR5_9HYPH|nr:sensor domain-containing diguanylate cyclase [Methylobacterium radiodurans]AWN36017.1 GGDEF domain-containing protein [Methylobacterium radiodurans]
MTALRRLAGPLRSPWAWTLLGMLAPIGMLVVSGLMLLDLRRDAWDKAEQTSRNLLQVIERDVARNVEIIDLSLQAIVENLKAPDLAEASRELRQLVLFDRVVAARDVGVVLILDERGDSIMDAASAIARRTNNADRDYFKAHAARSDLGLSISHPVVSRLTGAPIIVLSRRINKPDGSFGGVALASLSLSYFSRLFDRIDLGQQGTINLFHRDGTRIVRYPTPDPLSAPPPNFIHTTNFQRFLRQDRGTFVGTTFSDGVERHYTFVQFADLPLVLNVAVGTSEIDAEWRRKALVLGGILLALGGLTAGLSLLFGRELRHRTAIEAELARLSRTDVLTGLTNRRGFDEALGPACERARRTGRPLCLLIVDADHFKRYNDQYGHAVGDAVLKGLGRSLSASVHRPDDLVARLGGEEFAVLLPETDAAGAAHIAESIHAKVAELAFEGTGIQAGMVRVSIGLACGPPDTAAADLFRLADAALYSAKETGRNRTCCAPMPERPAVRPRASQGVTQP